jgi:DNA-binding LytR/AlgR family response regulator
MDSINGINFKYMMFKSGEELIDTYNRNGCIFDAIFLDMEMDDLNGINTANIIRAMDKHVIIVFVTSHTKYMQESFVCSPFRFLVKPVDFDTFKKIFLKIIEKTDEDKQTLSFTEGRSKLRLLCEDILFLQSVNHNTCIKTPLKLHKTYMPLSELKNKLNPNVFIQVHRSYIINMNYIRSISKNELTLRGYSHSIPIGNTYKSELESKFFAFEERKSLL